MGETICLLVVGLSGMWCYPDAQPVGECRETWYGQSCQVDDLPYFLSTYDPAQCQEHPTNCSDPSDPWHGAVRRLSPADYGDVAACHPDMLFQTLTFPDIPLEVVCEDSGGDRIHPTYREVWVFNDGPAHMEWMWVNVIDILNDHAANPWPWWSLQTWDGMLSG